MATLLPNQFTAYEFDAAETEVAQTFQVNHAFSQKSGQRSLGGKAAEQAAPGSQDIICANRMQINHPNK